MANSSSMYISLSKGLYTIAFSPEWGEPMFSPRGLKFLDTPEGRITVEVRAWEVGTHKHLDLREVPEGESTEDWGWCKKPMSPWEHWGVGELFGRGRINAELDGAWLRRERRYQAENAWVWEWIAEFESRIHEKHPKAEIVPNGNRFTIPWGLYVRLEKGGEQYFVPAKRNTYRVCQYSYDHEGSHEHVVLTL